MTRIQPKFLSKIAPNDAMGQQIILVRRTREGVDYTNHSWSRRGNAVDSMKGKGRYYMNIAILFLNMDSRDWKMGRNLRLDVVRMYTVDYQPVSSDPIVHQHHSFTLCFPPILIATSAHTRRSKAKRAALRMRFPSWFYLIFAVTN